MSAIDDSSSWLVISAGQGPVECALAVELIRKRLRTEAIEAGIRCRVLELEAGPRPGTTKSAVLELLGPEQAVRALAQSWSGTIQWTCPSPFRPGVKRKNWFVGVSEQQPIDDAPTEFGPVTFEAIRRGGPGGQHRNKTATGVRLLHHETGLVIEATEERSQLQNRRLALLRLRNTLDQHAATHRAEHQTEAWQLHQGLQRGNPTRTFRGPSFREVGRARGRDGRVR